MHRNLVPPVILEKLSTRCDSDNFDAVSLFADVSGFTQLTTQLMEHGKVGAEILAATLQSIFEPLVQAVAEQGGFVATFAGDAFQAIFPGGEIEQLRRATEAAWWIHQYLSENSTIQTRFGEFDFSVKVSLAEGEVTWRVWPPADDSSTQGCAQSRLFAFGGSGLGACMQGESLAGRGEVVLTRSAYETLRADEPALFPENGVKPVDETGDFVRVSAIADEYLPAPNIEARLLEYTPDELLAAQSFYPAELLESNSLGEFRDVVTIFMDLSDAPDATPNDAPAFMPTFLRLLHQYGGYLCRLDQKGASDKSATFLLFWGAPRSHENDVIRAVNFLLDLQAQTTIPFRAGLTYATAFAGYIGSPLREEYTCYSAHVTQAVRQMVKAEWGQILLDADTVRYAESHFELTHQGEIELKGYRGTKAIHNVIGRKSGIDEATYQGEMVGRAQEIETLRRAIQPLFDGRFGGVVTVTGEAGMGKSRLVHELQAQMQKPAEQPLRWGLCQTDEILRQPLNPFRYWLRNYFGQSVNADEAINKERFVAVFEELLAALTTQAGLSDQLGISEQPSLSDQSKLPDPNMTSELERTRSFLGALIDLRWDDSLYEQLEPELRFQNTLDALKTLIKAESRRQPLILFIEDIHWLDAESAEFLEKLVRNVDELPFAVVMTSRPNLGGEESARPTFDETPLTEIDLNQLSAGDLSDLATQVLTGAPSAELIELLGERAGGNPFFAEQILLYLREQNLLNRDNDTWQLRGAEVGSDAGTDTGSGTRAGRAGDVAQLMLPTDLRAVLTARLDQLDADVKQVVQAASILGREFDAPVLAHMLDDDPTLMAKINIAEGAAIWSVISDPHYFFRHATMRDAIYDMQLRSQRRSLHHKAGDALAQVYAAEPAPHYAELAYHYHEAEDTEHEREFAWLAGTYSAEQYANQDAIRYFSRALDLTPDHDLATQQTLLLEREAVFSTVGQRDEQTRDLRHLEEIAELQKEPGLQAEVALRNAAYSLATGSYPEATQFAEASATFAKAAGDPLAEARAYHRWGRSYWQAGDYEKAQARLEQALRLTRQVRSLLDEANCRYDLGIVNYYLGNVDEMFSQVKKAIELNGILNNQRGESICRSSYATFMSETGNYTEAIEEFNKSLELCRAVGWSYAEARILNLAGNNYLNSGDLKNGILYHERAVKMCNELGDSENIANSMDSLGLLVHFQGLYAKARHYYEQALLIYEETGDSRGIGYVLTHLGYTYTKLNERQLADQTFTRAVGILSKNQDHGLLMDALAGYAQLALKQRDIGAALNHVEKIMTWIDEHSVAGIEFPLQVYLICYQVISAATDSELHHYREVDSILQDAYILLREGLDKISDEKYRSSYLNNIPFNRRLNELWMAKG